MNASAKVAPSVYERVRAAYERWNIPEQFLQERAVDTKESLHKLLEAAEKHIADVACVVVPSSFDGNAADLRAYPRERSWQWHSCEEVLKYFNAHAVMMRLPLFWQMESALHAACRAVGAPIYMSDPENMAVGAEAIRAADMDTVVTEAKDAFTFSEHLAQRDVRLPRNWLIVQRADAQSWEVPPTLRTSGTNVAQEVHLMPGVPVLYQCVALAKKKEPLFHTSDAYVWETDTGKICITSAAEDLLPLFRLQMPFVLTPRGMCACGKALVGRA